MRAASQWPTPKKSMSASCAEMAARRLDHSAGNSFCL